MSMRDNLTTIHSPVAAQSVALIKPTSWYLKSLWIFDFDGTLVDSMGHFADLATDVIHDLYGTPRGIAREQYRQTSGLPFIEQVERIFPGDPRNRRAVVEYETAKAENYLEKKPFPEARYVLTELRERDCTVAISSNNMPHLVEAYCAEYEMPADIICGWSPGFAKGRAHFDHILSGNGRNLVVSVFVGDSLRDAGEAASFGMDFIARSGTFTADEMRERDPFMPVVDSLSELL